MPRRKRRQVSEEPDPLPLEGLSPAPRAVPWPLRVRLLLNSLVLFAGLLVGLAAVPIPSLLAANQPLLPWRDPPRWETTSGVLHGVHERNEKIRGRPGGTQHYFSYDYSFRLADGSTRQGSSHASSRLYSMPARKSGLAPDSPAVVIEYDPARPGHNRLQGTAAYFAPPWALVCLILSGVGTLMALSGAWWGTRRVRLLRNGNVAWATLTTCHTKQGKQNIVEDIVDFKQRCFAQVQRTRSGQESKLALGCGLFLALILSTFVGFFVAFVAVVGAFLMVSLLGVADDAMPVWILPVIGGGALVTTTALVMTWLIRRTRRQWQQPVEELVRSSFQRCSVSFIFALPDGTAVESRDTTSLTSSLEPEPQQPVLYDPLRPSRAILLMGLRPPLRVSTEGSWEATRLRVPHRISIALLGFAVGPIAGFAMWWLER